MWILWHTHKKKKSIQKEKWESEKNVLIKLNIQPTIGGTSFHILFRNFSVSFSSTTNVFFLLELSPNKKNVEATVWLLNLICCWLVRPLLLSGVNEREIFKCIGIVSMSIRVNGFLVRNTLLSLIKRFFFCSIKFFFRILAWEKKRDTFLQWTCWNEQQQKNS